MKVRTAETMRLIFCDCGCRGVAFELMGSGGKVFAAVEIPREAILIIAEQIVEHALSDDPIGEVAGHA